MLSPVLTALRKASPLPRGAASSGCAYEHSSVREASTSELRSAVICLMNRVRTRGGLPPLREQGQLDNAAQGHTDQMVAREFFAHSGPGNSTPPLRISAAGFNWGAYGEAISTGFGTPARAIAAWLRSTEHCQILLSPEYRDVGVGVQAQPVRGFATSPGTWTADLALPLGWAAPSRRWGLSDHCPY